MSPGSGKDLSIVYGVLGGSMTRKRGCTLHVVDILRLLAISLACHGAAEKHKSRLGIFRISSLMYIIPSTGIFEPIYTSYDNPLLPLPVSSSELYFYRILRNIVPRTRDDHLHVVYLPRIDVCMRRVSLCL